MSREKILSAVKNNQPSGQGSLDLPIFPGIETDAVSKFMEVLHGIGGKAFLVNNPDEILSMIEKDFKDSKWILSLSEFVSAENRAVSIPHEYEPLDLLIFDAQLGVAENSAIWITENEIRERVLPFITQQLAVVIRKENIVGTMHEAYEIIGGKEYGFATFIAGPSKTADIEQSLVLGAHGPKTMTIFILNG
jgi:L-lactate dehydrogenase complex protein LldG